MHSTCMITLMYILMYIWWHSSLEKDVTNKFLLKWISTSSLLSVSYTEGPIQVIPHQYHDPILVSSGNNTTNAVVSDPSYCTHRLIINHYHPHLLQYHLLHCYNDKCEVCIANYYQQSNGPIIRKGYLNLHMKHTYRSILK